ncbi:unnamed protein product [Symbiodinium pilosum]|uniref:Uncharacterized protein n=1 Tax=Symbiodinium pilosum TaxID=2952 RepID=A0A812XEI7_SYMPI|nr:unnamed protein product [Symbiodinium pilosum]
MLGLDHMGREEGLRGGQTEGKLGICAPRQRPNRVQQPGHCLFALASNKGLRPGLCGKTPAGRPRLLSSHPRLQICQGAEVWSARGRQPR